LSENIDKPIYVRVINGLANRLRTINSFYEFSKTSNRPLKICWVESQGFSEEKFDDFFENRLDLISVDEYENFSKNNHNLEVLFYKNPNNLDIYNFTISQEKIISIIQNESFCYNGDSCLEYIFPKFFPNPTYCFIKNLAIKPDIYLAINRIVKRFTPNTVGVHIRRGDAWLSPWKDYYEVSTDHAFIHAMNKELNREPETNFFLATDCKATQDLFLELFPNIIISNNQKNFFDGIDHTKYKPFQKDALIDMALLSRTKKIIGSNWSSFSYIASKMGGKDLIVAKE